MKIFCLKLSIFILLFAESVIAFEIFETQRLVNKLKSCKFLLSANESLSISDIMKIRGYCYFDIIALEHTKEFTNWEFLLYRNVPCTNETLCYQECHIPIKQDNDYNLDVDNQLSNCKLKERVPIFASGVRRQKREKESVSHAPAEPASYDDVVKYIDREGRKLADRYLGAGKDFATTFVNATKQEISDETMYNIFIRLMELECVIEGITHNCGTDDNTPYRLCKIEVLIKHRNGARFITFKNFCGDVNTPLTV